MSIEANELYVGEEKVAVQYNYLHPHHLELDLYEVDFPQLFKTLCKEHPYDKSFSLPLPFNYLRPKKQIYFKRYCQPNGVSLNNRKLWVVMIVCSDGWIEPEDFHNAEHYDTAIDQFNDHTFSKQLKKWIKKEYIYQVEEQVENLFKSKHDEMQQIFSL